jgi:hypothetical protein
MAKRITGVGKKRATRSHKTTKRLAAKRVRQAPKRAARAKKGKK